MSLILDGTNGVSDIDGSASTPAIRGTDTNTGIFFPAADTIAFAEGGAESMRIDSSGNLGIGTSSPTQKLDVSGNSAITGTGYLSLQRPIIPVVNQGSPQIAFQYYTTGTTYTTGALISASADGSWSVSSAPTNLLFYTTSSGSTSASERMRIGSSGTVLVGKTSDSLSVAGAYISPLGEIGLTQSGGVPLYINRLTNDGVLVQFRQDNSNEGDISVSGSTVSYNGGHLARWSQLPDNSKDDTILKGTVLTNLDDMCVWEKDGVVAENEQLNKMKVSDVEGDTNVAGVFVNWTIDADYGVDDMNIAMTGDMIIRIADGVVVQKGDLLMSAGDGTAKPQGDDIVRSKTIAKVTSNHVTCTYEDGSYCVPCVLMAC